MVEYYTGNDNWNKCEPKGNEEYPQADDKDHCQRKSAGGSSVAFCGGPRTSVRLNGQENFK